MDRSRTTQLLLRAKKGEAQALDGLYSRIGARLLSLIRVRMGADLHGRLEPEDVAQEVLLKAFQKIGDFEQDQSRSFFAWLAIIAGNTIRDLAAFHQQARRDARQTLAGEGSPAEIAAKHRSACSQVILDQELLQLESALGTLSERHREVIVLRQFEERPFSEVAEIMEMGEDACRMLFRRALAKLTVKLSHDRIA